MPLGLDGRKNAQKRQGKEENGALSSQYLEPIEKDWIQSLQGLAAKQHKDKPIRTAIEPIERSIALKPLRMGFKECKHWRQSAKDWLRSVYPLRSKGEGLETKPVLLRADCEGLETKRVPLDSKRVPLRSINVRIGCKR